MAYKKSTDTSSLKDILARVNGETITHKPVVYCASDISRAKNVLDRLLTQANSCEVSYTKKLVNIVEEN